MYGLSADPCCRSKPTMPLLTGESGESGHATPKLGDDAHPLSLMDTLITETLLPCAILKYGVRKDPKECVLSYVCLFCKYFYS